MASTRAHVARLLAGEIREYSYEKRYVRKDGRVVWTLTSVGLLHDPQGRPRQFVGVIEDITARKQAQDGERAARAEAERMSELKDEFLATLSHELRTPLSAILGWAQVIAAPPDGGAEELRGPCEVIERNARAQTQLIEDLLDMSRITSGKVRLDVQPVEPAAFIEAALETVRPAAEAKRIRLETGARPEGRARSRAIPGGCSRWSGTCSPTPSSSRPHGGKVQVVLARVNSHIEISVADTGIGIAPEFLPHVFDRFRQADGSTTRRHGGLGLGLAIAKHLVELHGGTLQAHSAGEGRGATFTVAPAADRGASRASPATERVASGGGARRRRRRRRCRTCAG